MTDHPAPRYIRTCPPGLCLVQPPTECTCLAVPVSDYAALDAERLLLEQQLQAITFALEKAGIKDNESGSDFVTRLANERQRVEEQVKELELSVLAWLGYWRDKIPPLAVTQVQDILASWKERRL